jgi:tetratricopeptide (TPR) repeat protein
LAGDLDAIVLKSLEKDAARRYTSAEQFADDIRRYLEGQPVQACLPTLGYRAVKFVRRHVVSVAAATVVAIALVIGVGLIVRAQRQAERQRVRAERRFNDVRKLANSLVFEIYDSIKDLSGATPSRKLLTSRALEYLDSLAAEAADDRSLQSELAAAYLRIGDVQGNPSQANQGDLAGALASYRKGLQILSSLSKVDSNDPTVLSRLSEAYYKIASCLDAMGDYQGALQDSRSSLTIDERLSARGDPKDIDNLAGDYNDIGLRLERIGELSGALESYRRAAEIRETIKTTNPKQISGVQLHLASDYAGQADVLMLQQHFSQAVRMQQRAVDIVKNISDKNPDNGALRVGLGQAYEFFGPILEKAGDRVQGLQNCRRAVAIFRQATAADPKDELTRRFLGFSYQCVGKLLVKNGEVEQGLVNLHQALAIFQSAPPAESENDFVLSGTAETYSGMGMAEAALATNKKLVFDQRVRHWREAESWYQRSLEIWAQMRNRGALARVDADKPEELTKEIAKCEARAVHP